MMDFEKIPMWLRWLLFIPSLLLTATLVYFVAESFISHWLSDFKSETFVYIVTRVIFNLFGLSICLLVSVSMIPKGKIILSSIYLAMILIVYTFSLSSFLLVETGDVYLWHILLEASLSLVSCVYVLWISIEWKKNEEKDKIIDL